MRARTAEGGMPTHLPAGEPAPLLGVLACCQHHADVWRLIDAGAAIFVCGNANTMAPAVRRAFQDVCRQQTGKSHADADAWLAALRADDRYLEDIWGGDSAPAGPAPSHDTDARATAAGAPLQQ